TRSAFLSRARTEAVSAAGDVLAGSSEPGEIESEVDQRLAAYSALDAGSLEQRVRAELPGAGDATSADDYVSLVGDRVRSDLNAAAVDSLRGGLGALADAAGNLANNASGFLGNVGSVLFKDAAGGARPADPRAVRARLGPGEPLDAGLASGMGAALGH